MCSHDLGGQDEEREFQRCGGNCEARTRVGRSVYRVFVYSSVSFTVSQTFVCDSLDDGKAYLRSEYIITFNTQRYGAYFVYASLMACVLHSVLLHSLRVGWCAIVVNLGSLTGKHHQTSSHTGIYGPHTNRHATAMRSSSLGVGPCSLERQSLFCPILPNRSRSCRC